MNAVTNLRLVMNGEEVSQLPATRIQYLLAIYRKLADVLNIIIGGYGKEDLYRA